MTKQIDPKSVFPPSWRDCCRRVVEIYADIQEEQTGQKFGSTRLARAMRKLHEVPGDDRANERLEQALTRQDIEAWLNKGSEFSDWKFKFVDAFVRHIATGDHGKEIRQLVEDERESSLCDALWTTFGYNDGTETPEKAFPIPGAMLRTNVMSSVSRTCILVIKNHHSSVLCADLVFFSHSNNFPDISIDEKIERQISSARLLSAYFIPVSSSTHGRSRQTTSGTVLICDPSLTKFGRYPCMYRGASLIEFLMTTGSVRVSSNPATLDAILHTAEQSETSSELMLDLQYSSTSFYDAIIRRVTAGYLR